MSKDKIKMIAIVFALLFVTLDYFLDNKTNNQNAVEAYVLKEDIEKGSVLSSEDIEKVSIQSDQIPIDLCQEKEAILNRPVQINLRAGTYLQSSFFESNHEHKLSAVIPKGYEAVTIDVDETSGVAWSLKPNDRVKIISINSEGKSKVLFENVLVLALDSVFDESIPVEVYQTVTVALKPKDSLKLLSAKQKQSLHLILQRNELQEIKEEKKS